MEDHATRFVKSNSSIERHRKHLMFEMHIDEENFQAFHPHFATNFLKTEIEIENEFLHKTMELPDPGQYEKLQAYMEENY